MTPEQLGQVMPAMVAARRQTWADYLNAACDRFDIRGARRQAAFLAQLAHESADLTRLQENLRYSSADRILAVFGSRRFAGRDVEIFVHNAEALANLVYANRLGNGDEASGDGWRFRGRGGIQLTGRRNYRMCGDGVGEDYENNPDLLLDPKHATLSSAWFWKANGCNELADLLDMVGITQRINGPALAGLDDRQAKWNLAMAAFPERGPYA